MHIILKEITRINHTGFQHTQTTMTENLGSTQGWRLAKRLCDVPSVLADVNMFISFRFQTSPLASKAACSIVKRRAWCISLSLLVHSLSTASPVQCHLVVAGVTGYRRGPNIEPAKANNYVWPNGGAGGWGKEKFQMLQQRKRSDSKLSRCKWPHPDTSPDKRHSGWRGGRTDMSTSRQHQQEITAARLRGQLRASTGCRRCWKAIPGPGREDSTTLVCLLPRRRKISNKNQDVAGAYIRPTRGKENPKKNRVQGASPDEPCHRRRRIVAHAACATYKTDCSPTYDTMAVQLSLELCGVVLLDRGWGGTEPGSQPHRSPTSATDSAPETSGLTMDGQSSANGQHALKFALWNAEGVWFKKTELQHFLKGKAIDMCRFQRHICQALIAFIRGYEVFWQDRENWSKGGLLSLVRNNIPAAEIQRSGQGDLDTECLRVKLVLSVTVSNIYSPPDEQIQLHVKVSSKKKNQEGCLPTLCTQTWYSSPKIASSGKAWTTSTKNCAGNTKALWVHQ